MMNIDKSIGSRSRKNRKANDASAGTSAKIKCFNFLRNFEKPVDVFLDIS